MNISVQQLYYEYKYIINDNEMFLGFQLQKWQNCSKANITYIALFCHVVTLASTRCNHSSTSWVYKMQFTINTMLAILSPCANWYFVRIMNELATVTARTTTKPIVIQAVAHSYITSWTLSRSVLKTFPSETPRMTKRQNFANNQKWK